MKKLFPIIPALAYCFLAACGGGSSKPITNDPPPVLGTMANQSVQIGNPVTFAVPVISGTPPFTFSWTVDGATQTDNSGTLTITPNATGTEAIVVTVSNAVGNESRSATLTVTAAPSGSTITLVQATGADFNQFALSYPIAFTNPVGTSDTVKIGVWTQGDGIGSFVSFPAGSVVDDQRNVYSLVSPAVDPPALNSGVNTGPQLWIFQATHVNGTPRTITFTPVITYYGSPADVIAAPVVICTGISASNQTNCPVNWSLSAAEFANSTGAVDAGAWENQSLSASMTNTEFQMGAIVTHSANEIVYAVGQSNACNGGLPGMIGPGNNWTSVWTSQSQGTGSTGTWCMETEFQIVASPGDVTPTFFVHNQANQTESFQGSAVATQ